MPTLLELSGSQKPKEVKGVPVPKPPGSSFAKFFGKDDPALLGSYWWLHENHRALRSGDWKLVALAGGNWELYDLARDRGESNDLAASLPEKVKELEQIWTSQLEETERLRGGNGEDAR